MISAPTMGYEQRAKLRFITLPRRRIALLFYNYNRFFIFWLNKLLRVSGGKMNSDFSLANYPLRRYHKTIKSAKESIMLNLLKAVLFGIVEGITEWLPVSSTGHLILLDEFIRLDISPEFSEMFEVVIQLGAILAVIVLFFHKLNPLSPKKDAPARQNTWQLWFKVVAAMIPSAVLGVAMELLDLDKLLYHYVVVAIALIVYGVAFIALERRGRETKIDDVYAIDYKTALLIGAFQCLSLIPGTSRSGSTILGAIILGVSRPAGAEFSFFLAIPTMLGASALKTLMFLTSGVTATAMELGVLAVGCVVSFGVSLLVIRVLMDYVRRHSFSAFGVYRIVLGALVLGYFLLK